MKTTNKTARALSLSILSTFLCVVMLFGMTYAWFRVEVNSDNNVIKIGAFDAKVYYHDTYIAANAPGWADFAGATVFNTTLFPGDEVVRYIKFENNCGYPVKFDLVLPAGATFDTDGKVNNLYVYTADSVSDTVTVSAMTSLNNLGAIGTAATAEAPTQLITKMLAANTSAIVAVGIKLPDTYSTPSSTDTSETFKLRVIATQWNAPHVTVTNASAAQTLSTGQVTVTVPAADVAANDNLVLTVSNVVETTGTLSCDITLKKNDVTVTSAPAPIAVDINVGTGKTITSVKHNGTDIPFTYNASTGILSFTTSSFSPFEVKFLEGIYVATDGTNGYETLQEAFNSAADSSTLVLLTDITQDDGFSFNKANTTVKLDLNGKKITVNTGSNVNNRAIKINAGTLEVYNGTIDAKGSGTNSTNGAGCYGAFRIEADGKLIAHDLTLNNTRPWGLNVKVLGGEAELTNVTINSSYGGGIEVTEANLGTQSKPGSATLTNCTFNQENYFDHCSTAISVSGGSELTVISGTYTGEYAAYVFSSGGYIDIQGGTFTGLCNGGRKAFIAAIDTNTYPQYEGGIRISGGTFSGGAQITSPASMVISGGTFDFDPTDYLAPADEFVYTAEENPTGTWTVLANAQ